MEEGRKLLKKYPINVSDTDSLKVTDISCAIIISRSLIEATSMANKKHRKPTRKIGPFVEAKAFSIWGYLPLMIYSNNTKKKILTNTLTAEDSSFFIMSLIIYHKVGFM